MLASLKTSAIIQDSTDGFRFTREMNMQLRTRPSFNACENNKISTSLLWNVELFMITQFHVWYIEKRCSLTKLFANYKVWQLWWFWANDRKKICTEEESKRETTDFVVLKRFWTGHRVKWGIYCTELHIKWKVQ